MIKKMALLLCLACVIFFSISTIHADDVNITDSNTTLEMGDVESVDSDDLSSAIEEPSLTDTVKNQTEISANSKTIYYKGSYSVTIRDSNSTQPIANKTVNFIINDVKYNAVSDDEGVARVNLSLTPGKYSAIAYFEGDDTYLPSNNLTSTIKVMATVNAKDITKYYKGATQYSATFYDSNGSVLANRDVVITVNGKSHTVKTNSKGVAYLALNFKPGTYKVIATDPITGYKAKTTFKILSTIKSANLKKVKGDSRKFVVKFFKSNGKPLAKQYVKLKIKGKIHKIKTNSKGQAILTFNNFKKGTYKVISYNKDGLSKTNTVKLFKIANTKLTTKFYTFLPDDDKKIEVRLSTSLGGKANSGKVIKIKMNGKTYSKKTDGDGIVSLKAPSKKGLYTVEYSYKGNRFFKAAKSKNFVTVLDSTKAKLNVKGTSNFGYGAGTPLKTSLTAGGVPLIKRTITFKIDGKTYKKTTDKKGMVSIPINLKIGDYTVDYKTNKKYKVDGISGSCSITVFKRSASKLTWKCGNSYKDSSQSFKILLSDSDGKAISGEVIEFTIDGETYYAKTASKGYAKIKTNVAIGKYKVSAKFKGSNDFLPKHASKSINVKLSKFGNGINERNSISYLGSFLKSSSHCSVNNGKIKSLVKSLTKGLKNKIDKAKAIYNFVRDCVKYKSYYDTRYGSVGTLNLKHANCVDQAHLLIAMYRTAGFKARYVHGTCTFHDGRFGHVWTQVLIDKHWVCGDPTNQVNSLGKINSWNTHTYVVHSKYQSLPF